MSKRTTKDNSYSGSSEQLTTSSDINKTDEAVIGAILSRVEDERIDTESVSSKASSSSSSSTVQPTEDGRKVPLATNINDTLLELRDLVRTEMASLKRGQYIIFGQISI